VKSGSNNQSEGPPPYAIGTSVGGRGSYGGSDGTMVVMLEHVATHHATYTHTTL